jgi:hypothetical protein
LAAIAAINTRKKCVSIGTLERAVQISWTQTQLLTDSHIRAAVGAKLAMAQKEIESVRSSIPTGHEEWSCSAYGRVSAGRTSTGDCTAPVRK